MHTTLTSAGFVYVQGLGQSLMQTRMMTMLPSAINCTSKANQQERVSVPNLRPKVMMQILQYVD